MLDPDMPDQELRLHMGELTASEMLVARAAIRWANAAIRAGRTPKPAKRPEDDPRYPGLLADAQARVRGENLDGSPRREAVPVKREGE